MNNENEKWLSLLGLAARARQIVTGEELVIKEVRAGKVKLVLLSQDASENTKKKLLDKCRHYQVQVRLVGNRATLGQAIGKAERVVIGIKEDGFAKKMTAFIDQ
ncbi:50S ribosomal protein L7AE-like protein [Bacillus sp. TS-2]|nr:50S ribosomal protein L7AE-like protein [Bacillus sp. TS-2]